MAQHANPNKIKDALVNTAVTAAEGLTKAGTTFCHAFSKISQNPNAFFIGRKPGPLSLSNSELHHYDAELTSNNSAPF